MNIAQNLSALMKTRNLSNSRLAREIGVHPSTVANWLQGKIVNPEKLEALCKYFDCSLDYLSGNEKLPADSEQFEESYEVGGAQGKVATDRCMGATTS